MPNAPPLEPELRMDVIVEQLEDHTFAATTDIVNLRWPPIVTAVPEVPPAAGATTDGVTTSAIEAQFCQDRSRCRILLPLWIGEQESRGRMHLTQLVHLATALNRTLVLPNVGKSRLGTCGKWSFEAYYDTGSLARQLKDVSGGNEKLMLMDDFKTWLDMRPDKPHGQVLFLHEEDISPETQQGTFLGSREGFSLFVDDEILLTNDHRLKNAYCLKTKYRALRLDGHYPLSLYLAPPEIIPPNPPVIPSGDLLAELLLQPATSQKSIAQELPPDHTLYFQDVPDMASLAAQDAPSDPDVLLVQWNLRHLPFVTPETLSPLQYSEKLWQFSRRLTGPYRPYLTVHWRMETVDPTVLPDCAEALIDTLSTLLADPTLAQGIETVWLATDGPWSSSAALARSPERLSNTFKAWKPQHFEAIGIVKAAFAEDGPLEEWKLTGLGEEIRRLKSDHPDEELMLAHEDDTGMLWEDSGIWGILDKMAAMESSLFVSGARGCGRVRLVSMSVIELHKN